MGQLDDIKRITRLDSQGMLRSIESLGLQCQQAWEESQKVVIPASYRQCTTILINGMGGSALGGHVIEALYGKQIRVPLKIINSYSLPGFVSSKTLYVLSSYSGTTEEVLATFNAARKKKAKLLIICAGGKLAALAKQHRLPAYIFTPRFNPCNQPRMGLGYSVMGQLGLLARSGFLTVNKGELIIAIRSLIRFHHRFGVRARQAVNPAKQTALKLRNKLPIIIAAEHLSGNAHIFSNQINENSKNFAAYFLISEMNHHLLEGLPFPKTNRHLLSFSFINSKLYLPQIIKRFAITRKVLDKNHIGFSSYQAQSHSPLAQSLEVLLFGSYVNFYLAILNGIDPSPIPFVDFFKKQLERK
jgi:glucose/mannose-6-phosphate isomerase